MVGVARSLLALGTLLTLVFSPTNVLFPPEILRGLGGTCSGNAALSLFCLLPGNLAGLGRAIAILSLLVVASGWRPRFTGILHWWVTMSLFVASVVVDGGDQISMILTLALVPVTLLDDRTWHWQTPPRRVTDSSTAHLCGSLAALLILTGVRVQVAAVYLEAAVAKTRVPEWRDGTAVYYWMTDVGFGVDGLRRAIIAPLLTIGPIVAALTWGAITLELFLFAGLLMDRRYRRVFLVLGILFHVTIALVHGLISFGCAMSAALVLYLRPLDQPFVPPETVRRLDAFAHGLAFGRDRWRPLGWLGQERSRAGAVSTSSPEDRSCVVPEAGFPRV